MVAENIHLPSEFLLLFLFFLPWKYTEKEGLGQSMIALLQRIFPTQGSNPLLHCRQILYQLSYEGSPTYEIGILISKNVTFY